MLNLSTQEISPSQPGSSSVHPAANSKVVACLLHGDRRFDVLSVPGGAELISHHNAGEQHCAQFTLSGRNFVLVERHHRDNNDMPYDGNDIARLLTKRELQVAVLVAQGNPVKRVADRIGITDWTVKEYLRRIYVKLGVRNQAAMVFRCAALLQQLDRAGG